MPSKTTPEARAAKSQDPVKQVRRRYKKNITTRTKFIEGEEGLVKDMVVILKLANYSHSQIGTIVGVSRGQVKEYLAEPAVQKKLLALRAGIPQAALQLLEAMLIEAAVTVVHVMRTETDNALVLKAASEIFDRAGLPKLSRQEKKVDGDSPLTGIGRGGHEDVLTDIANLTPEIQEKAAQLYDLFETGLKNLIEEAKEGAADEASGKS